MCELHRVAQVRTPVAGLGQLFGDPAACHAGDDGQLWRRERGRAHGFLERVQHRVEHRGVCCHRNRQPSGLEACALQGLGDGRHRGAGPRNHHAGRAVDDPDRCVRVGLDKGGHRLGRGHHGHHFPCCLLHQLPAPGHQTQPLLQTKDARHVGCGKVAQAVPKHGSRSDPPFAPELRQRTFQRIVGCLSAGVGVHQVGGLAGGCLGVRRCVEQFHQRTAVTILEGPVAAVEDRAEHGFCLVELPPHADVLRPLAGE